MDWNETDSYLRGVYNGLNKIKQPLRVAAFDLDDTIIYKTNKKTEDIKFKFLDLNITAKIADLALKHYAIIIFTNQATMSINKKFDKNKWRNTIDELFATMTKDVETEFYFAVYGAKRYDLNRKPNTGMWTLMKSDIMDEFDLESLPVSTKSFYCGDAAGRIEPSIFKKKLCPSSHKGDFADSDRKFAMNIGINFMTPEEFYLDDAPVMKYRLTGFNPGKYLKSLKTQPKYKFNPRSKELIIMIGFQGSGKSEFVRRYLIPNDYVVVNLDQCKTVKRCIKIASDAMAKKQSVVIDNTNPDIYSRFQYISLAQEHKYRRIRAIVMNTDIDLAKHLNNTRHIHSNGTVPKIPDMAYNIYKKKYIKPTTNEHFDLIETVDFVFDQTKLDDPEWKKVFMKWS